MALVRNLALALTLTTASVALVGLPNTANAAPTTHELDADSQTSLSSLESTNGFARRLAHEAKAILIFPNVVKAGLIFGGAYGEGELIEGSKVEGYFNSITGSWGLQAGGQSYSYVVFLMTDNALKYVHDTHGWEIGVGPTVVVVDEGVAKNLSTSTLKDDAYAFIYGQQGLMAGISIEGTKISHVHM
jgi:lipid-binding SYLF domain-containing protein